MTRSTMFLLLVRYLAGVVSFGITFAGAWLYEFTTTDEKTKTRKLTKWGNKALVWIILSLFINVVLTVWTDWAAQKKEKADAYETHKKDTQITQYQQKSEQRQEDIVKLLDLLNSNLGRLDPSLREKVKNTVQSLNMITNYENQFPDLYSQAVEAVEALKKGVNRKVDERVSSDPKCAGLPIHSHPDSPFKTGTIALHKPGDMSTALSYTVTGEGVSFYVADYSGASDLSHGYSLEFADGSTSQKLTCSTGTKVASCRAETFTSTQAKALYRLVQGKLVRRVRTGIRSFDVDSASAKELMTTFSCIEP